MTDLIERYVHQVGRYLPEKDRRDVMTELRSQIQDQLEDRYGKTPAQPEIAAMLTQLGAPHKIAASYAGEQYLVGPDLYPTMMMVLRGGLPLVPGIVVIINIISAVASNETGDWIGPLIGSVLSALQATFFFAAAVVGIFAIIQRSDEKLDQIVEPFNPLELPAVDDPRAVDRVEAAFGIAISTFIGLALLYFTRVGGLTLRFDLNAPGNVIPVPVGWLLVLIGFTIAMIALNVWALLRNHWSRWTWLALTLLEFVGAVGMYFALWLPLFQYLTEVQPALAEPFMFDRQPIIILIISIGIAILSSGRKLYRLWRQGQGSALSATRHMSR
ncbi:MAG: hypothetical protein SF123_26295 [Chloroflexota bacterium]|nr:hypothetical protein [Chloroflexota bacterium]